MADETYYSLLEISETASAAEIKAAYLRLIREVHPDRLANAPAYWRRQAEEKTKEINEAYTILSNSEKRSLYDAQLAAYRGSNGTPGRQASPSQSAASARSSWGRDSQHSARTRSASGVRPGSARNSRASHRQPNAAANPAAAANAARRRSPQPSDSWMGSGERFFLAFVGGVCAFGAAVVFWDSSSVRVDMFSFLLATTLLFGVACLYRRQIGRMLMAMGSKRHQLWVTIVFIVIMLLVGRAANKTQKFAVQTQLTVPQYTLGGSRKANSAGNDGSKSRDSHHPPEWPGTEASGAQSGNPASGAQTADSDSQTSRSNGAEEGLQSQPVQQPAPDGDRPASGRDDEFRNACTPLPGEGFSAAAARTSCCEKGFGGSCSNLARFYETGAQGLPRDLSMARELRLRACDMGISDECPAGPVPGVSGNYDLSGVSVSDRASIESACSGARLLDGAASYHRCLNQQLEDLAHSPIAPDLSRLSGVDRGSIESACSGARLLRGAASYHLCLNRQLEQLAKYPNAPDMSRLSSVDRESIESACSGARLLRGAASYHRCLSDQLADLRGR